MDDDEIDEWLAEAAREDERRRFMDMLNRYGEVIWPWPAERPGVVPDLARRGGAERNEPVVAVRGPLDVTGEIELAVVLTGQRRRLSDILHAWACLCRQCSMSALTQKE
eukprot:13915837-Heterocapsa_arctica.AAC.1